MAARFWEKVDRRGAEECWRWLGAVDPQSGYGRFHLAGRTAHAHRVAYTLSGGVIPEGLFVLHSCEVVGDISDRSSRTCVNPAHLRVGTALENAADARAAQRIKRPGAKLTPQLVREARLRYMAGEKQKDIAAELGVAKATLSQAISGRQWSAVR